MIANGPLVVVAQLAERLLPISEDAFSNPIIGNFDRTFDSNILS